MRDVSVRGGDPTDVDGDVLAAAAAALGGVALEPVDRLRSGERSQVIRVRAGAEIDGSTDLVVKRFVAAGEGWVRESSALLTVAGTGAAPALLACVAEPPLLVLHFAGDGRSVADALLGDDPHAAAAALTAWAEAVADLHVASRDSRDRFRAEVREREGELPVADAAMATAFDETVRRLEDECAALGVALPPGCGDTLRELGHRLGESGPAALSPSDTCPDNNVLAGPGARVTLLDFEGAQWRHLAWDVAYLRVPWPTCWCAWDLPGAVSGAAVAAYTARAGTAYPEVAGPEFARDVDAAVLAWSLMSTVWSLPSIRAGDPPPDPARPAPSRRAVAQHRLARAAELADRAELAPLGALCRDLAAELARRFGTAELAVAPAFRAGAASGQ